MHWRLFGLLSALSCVACGSSDDDPSSAQPSGDVREAQIRDDVRHSAFEEIQVLVQSVDDLCVQAPKHDYEGSGWDATADATAIEGMEVSWREARAAYEHSKAVIAPQFPDSAAQVDGRYEDYSVNAWAIFTGQNWGGMHAIERVLWADRIPALVVESESALPNYVAASWPVTGKDAVEFERDMCPALSNDLSVLQNQLAVSTLDVDAVFRQLAASMSEPREQLMKSVSGMDDSRYSQRTLADLRETLIGTRKTYGFFREYVRSKPNGVKVDAKILAGFDALAGAYHQVPGDTFPAAPASWSSENPTTADLATPFGRLYQAVEAAGDLDDEQSLVNQMNVAGDLLGFESSE